MEEKGEFNHRSERHGRWLYFCLGVFLAATVGLAIALGITIANNDDDNDIQAPPTQAPSSSDDAPALCTSSPCVLRAGELLQAMDRNVDPCDDFYLYSCGKWTMTHSIPESESSYSRFSELRDNVRLELKGLLEKPYDSATESVSIKKAKQLYQSCINEDNLTSIGTGPLKDLVNGLRASWSLITGNQPAPTIDLESLLVKIGLVELSPLLDVGVYQDIKNSSSYITWIDQLSLGMSRDYMLKGRNSPEVKAYEELCRQQAIHILNVSPSGSLDQAISDLVEFEITLANLTASKTERRDEGKFYKKMTVSQLSTAIPGFNWNKYLTTYLGAANITVTNDMEVVVFAEDYLKNMLDLYSRTDKRVVSNFLLLHVVGGYAGYLSKDIRDLNGPLRKVLYGVTQTRARWKTCVDLLNGNFMPTAVGQLYVKTYFTSGAKDKALEMVGYIRKSMKQLISNVEWMDAVTKARALEKADAIIQKIGYPEYQFNETVLEDFYGDVNYQPDTYFQNALDAAGLAVIKNSKNLNRTPSRKDWSDSASTVNAFYSPTKNTITFPAGILQPPFYGEDFPMSMMFGGIGMVIGHEITHGFDDQGRKYDKEGNSIPWWSDSSVTHYQTYADCFAQQYSDQVVVGLHVNGNMTLGENIADNGGIKAAYTAFQEWQSLNGKQPVMPGLGLSHEQLFFVNFAQGWCNLMTDEGARDRILTDVHSPASVRVRVPLSNSDAFAEAFQCPVGSKMNPAKKCALW